MNRTIWHRIAIGLFAAALVSGLVFAFKGTHPAWMMATFWFTFGGVITTAIAISSA